MPVVILTLDTSCTGKEEIEDFTQDGEIIGATGLINLKWEDFSAIDIAKDIGFQGIIWQASNDDTPGNLSLTVNYPNLSLDEVEARFKNRHEVDEYEIQNSLNLVYYG